MVGAHTHDALKY